MFEILLTCKPEELQQNAETNFYVFKIGECRGVHLCFKETCT